MGRVLRGRPRCLPSTLPPPPRFLPVELTPAAVAAATSAAAARTGRRRQRRWPARCGAAAARTAASAGNTIHAHYRVAPGVAAPPGTSAPLGGGACRARGGVGPVGGRGGGVPSRVAPRPTLWAAAGDFSYPPRPATVVATPWHPSTLAEPATGAVGGVERRGRRSRGGGADRRPRCGRVWSADVARAHAAVGSMHCRRRVGGRVWRGWRGGRGHSRSWVAAAMRCGRPTERRCQSSQRSSMEQP